MVHGLNRSLPHRLQPHADETFDELRVGQAGLERGLSEVFVGGEEGFGLASMKSISLAGVTRRCTRAQPSMVKSWKMRLQV